MRYLAYSFIIFLSLMNNINAQDIFDHITYGKVAIGESRIPLSSKDFFIETNIKGIKSRARLVKNSIQWVRVGGVLLKPRARLRIDLKGDAKHFHIKYDGQNILFHQFKSKFSRSELFVSLFQPDDIQIFYKDKQVGHIRIFPSLNIKNRVTHVIDYSCSRNNVQIKGLENEFISVGCRHLTIGQFPNEKHMLELFWTSADYTLLDRGPTPYLATFVDNSPVKMQVINRRGQIKNLEISVNIPQRKHRLKTAYGFGPYSFYSKEAGLEKESQIVPAFFFYAKFDLDESNSLRLFDALLYKETLFNNIGFYYANDVAKIYDQKITITTLLGAQGINYKFDSDSESLNEFIFPQGLEITWMHAFGIKNYLVSYGMFLSPSDSVKYNNLWVRWGKKYFWEINYIDWGTDDKYAKTWGLSVGIPFKQFF